MLKANEQLLILLIAGDTIRVVYNTQHEGYKQLILRLYGIDAPEIRSKDPKEKLAATQARDALLGMMLQEPVQAGMSEKQVDAVLDGRCVVIRVVCKAFDKYGRVLANLHSPDDIDQARSYNSSLVELGHAKAYFGKTKEPWHFE